MKIRLLSGVFVVWLVAVTSVASAGGPKEPEAAGPAAAVVLPNGEPAVGARVVLTTRLSRPYIRNGRKIDANGALTAETGQPGLFSFPPQDEQYKIAVIHEKGCAEIAKDELQRKGQIELQPWGRIEGVRMVGSRPAPGERVMAYRRTMTPFPTRPQIHWTWTARAGRKGRFVLDRVRPGELAVARWVRKKLGGGSFTVTNTGSFRVEVKPGETMKVQVGGKGRPVAGKLVVPEDAEQEVQMDYSDAGLYVRVPGPDMPDDYGQMTDDEKKKWREEWMEKEGIGKTRWLHTSFLVNVNRDGSFRVEDVRPAVYGLNVDVLEPPQSGQRRERIGSAGCEVIVPHPPGGYSPEPVDLGEIPVNIFLAAGDQAPPFEVKTFDCGTIRLKDFRGKCLLLCFWATHSKSSLAQMPHLKKIFERFGAREDFAMVGLSLDSDAEEARKYVAEKDLDWSQAFLGSLPESEVADDYDVQRLPAILLIGPNAKVVARDLRGERLEKTVADSVRGK